MASNNQKDTVYIDIDDEITSIIDKVRSSNQRIVALVLPKRATVLQSLVNMKLLKRSAEQAKKHVVLITTEAGLLPLAGAVGMYVAPSLQSKPVIPAAEGAAAGALAAESEIDESADFDPDAEAATPVGNLAGSAAFAGEELETIELDNEPEPTGAAGGTAGVAGAAAGAVKAKKDKKLKIPDFNKFRLGLVLGGVLLIALIIFAYLATAVLPKATVTLVTDTSDIPTNASVTLDPSLDELDLEDNILPAKIATKQQSSSQQVATTGQKNNGQKAGGSVTLSLKDCSEDEVTVPAGTGVSSDGKTFITQSSVTLESVKVGSKCSNSSFKNISTQDVDVVAQSAGAAYNIDASTFAVASFSNVSGESSDPMTGGTDNIVKVVSASDIDNAKQKITSGNSSSIKSNLEDQLQNEGYQAITDSLSSGEPTVTTSAQVGDTADVVTVTSSTTYTMYGVKADDIRGIILANVKTKIDPTKQKILDDGVSHATFSITSPASSGQLQAQLSATTLAGPELHPDALKSQIAGKKTNDVRTIATATPGVSDVSIKYSPFWVSKVPKKTSKITIIIQKADGSKNSPGSSDANNQ